MDPVHYKLAKAAEILNYSEDELIHNAAWNYDGNGLTIHVLTACFNVVPMHIDAKGIKDEYAPIPAKIEELTQQCQQEWEAGKHEVPVQLKRKPFYEIDGSPNGYWYYELRRKNVIYPSIEELKEAVNRGIDLDSITPPPIRLNECTMIVLAEDLERIKKEKQKLTKSERDNLLKQVGLLALVLSEKGSKYKRGEQPNANQIAEDIQLIVDAFPFQGKKGTGSTKIRDSISKGIELLIG